MIDQLTQLVRQLTISQRIGILFGSLFSVLILVGLVMWAGTPQMQRAFSKLSTADAGTITSALDSAGIAYQLEDAGATIMVSGSELAAARIAAGSAGFSGDGTTGWELFDKSGFGASEFDQQVAYQRATQGELTRRIKQIEGVADASVTVVASRTGALTSDDRPASASVYVKMLDRRHPSDSQVQGIVALVAGSVSGLVPGNVTVVDADGTVLAGPDNASSSALTIQNTVERDYAAKVQAYLASILGPGKSSVAVTASLDLDKVAKTVTSFSPDASGNPPSSWQWSQEKVANGAGAGAAGIPGTASNVAGIPTYPNASPAASPGSSATPDYLKQGSTINYANSQTVAQIVQTPGSIKRLSVAVLVDQDAMTASAIPQPQLEEAVGIAVGLQADERGDVVKLIPAKFVADTAVAAPGPDIMVILGDVLPTVGGVLLALVLLFLVWRNMRALRGRADEMQLMSARVSAPALGTGELAMAGAGRGGFREADLPELAATSSAQARIQDRIRLMAEDRPDELAGLVNTWLNDDEKSRRR